MKHRYPRKRWTSDEIAYLEAHYPHQSTKAVAAALGWPIDAVYRKANSMGLLKSEEYLKTGPSGRIRPGECLAGSEAYRFRPGQMPANKGLRRPGWGPGRMKTTQFKPGNRTGVAAHNWVPVGTIKRDSDGYLRIKVRDAERREATGFGNTGVWPLMQRHVWEKMRGPIPPGHVVCFRDGNRDNCAIENLELVSRADLARRNQMWANLPRDLAEVIQLKGALKRKLRRMRDGKK